VASAAQNELRRSYAAGLQGYLRDPNERTLHAAYELGREAVTRELDVLDLALAHHEALAATLRAGDPDDIAQVTRSAGDFLVDSLSAFEMLRRAYAEARDAAALERRQASMLRQLSSLLADASLALDAGSLEEMFRLVAEQARELTRAACCVAALADTDGPAVEVASFDDADEYLAAFAESAGLPALASGRAVRMSGDELAAHPAARHFDLRGAGWLGAPLTTLDERQVGWIQLLAGAGAEFTEIDEAVLGHLAQMTSATVERARMYSRSRS
jgi:GAF domain-containing protein/phosphoserine phosphatase RsbU-like protein